MKIRFINNKVNPLPHAAAWIKFVCKYPFLYLAPAIGMFIAARFFWIRLAEFESGERDSIYLGHLKYLYKSFGKWGVMGFFIFLIACFLYLFWLYALSKPKR